jgi:DNA-binding transcriptional regulator GbsR (MarR family)
MNASPSNPNQAARERLVDLGGRMAQDLGFSRIAGQLLAYLYLTNGECSLDRIQEDLGLSKAAASIAARQLESMGLLRRVWKPGDRRNYYRTADNLGEVFRDGLISMLRRKLEQAGAELDQTHEMTRGSADGDGDAQFLAGRIQRARDLSRRANRILNSRIRRYLAR